MQLQTIERMPLLDSKGRLMQPSWATEDVFAYNKENLRPAFRRKEWEIYQLLNEDFFLQLTYGHMACAGKVEALLVDFVTGERYTAGSRRLFPGDSMDLDFSAQQPHSLHHQDGKLFLSIHTTDERRQLEWRSRELAGKLLCSHAGEAVCVATPFANPQQFYYHYKKIFPELRGRIRFRGRELELDKDSLLRLHSGRGVLPYRHEWIWGSGAKHFGSHVLGINIGWGFGSDEAPTENALFWDGKLHKLERIWVDRNQDPMQPWRFQSSDRRFDLRFEPYYDHFTKGRCLLMFARRHQVFGKLYGTVYLDDGRGIKVDGMHFICEHTEGRG